MIGFNGYTRMFVFAAVCSFRGLRFLNSVSNDLFVEYQAWGSGK